MSYREIFCLFIIITAMWFQSIDMSMFVGFAVVNLIIYKVYDNMLNHIKFL